jgi:hypothetical protein
MKKSRATLMYGIMVLISVTFVIWTLLHSFVFDPKATSFLSHKTHVAHPLHVHTWISVLHIHIAFACLAMIAGAINFSSKVLRSNRLFHRMNGYGYIICVVAVCITSGYMGPNATGGRLNSLAFNIMNVLWIITTATAFVQIKRRHVASHRRWMVRSYMFCFTNLLIHVLMFACCSVIGVAYDLGYTISVYGSIVLNFLISEIVMRIVFTTPKISMESI